MMTRPNKKLERRLIKSGKNWIIGVDEVGMGSLAGPVVVCAALFLNKFYGRRNPKLMGIKDSKSLSPRQREKFERELSRDGQVKFAISYCYPKTIDRINIYQAVRLAMRRAVRRVIKKIQKNQKLLLSFYHDRSKMKVVKNQKNQGRQVAVLVDGPGKIPGLDLDQIPVIKGDRGVFAIACASIIAKVYRDKMMTRYARKFPDYGFEKHKGYGTKLHLTTLASFGPSLIHRHSFAPVAELL